MNVLNKKLTIFCLSIASLGSIISPKIAHTQTIDNKMNNLSLNAQQRKEVKDIIKKYLQKNPETIIQSIQTMREQQKNNITERNQKNVAIYKELILNDPTSPTSGNPEGDITVVEFFDYSCGYCKRIFPNLKRLMKEDENVRFVFKELPILSPQSEFAARAALATWRQDNKKYMAIHSAFMNLKGNFSEMRILRIAKNIGLNITQLKKDIKSLTLDKIIIGNRQLAEKLNINGTPGFIIGNNIIPGAVKLETLKEIIADVRKTKTAS